MKGFTACFALCIFIGFQASINAGEMPPSPVSVSKAVSRAVPVTLEGTGHVIPFTRIELKSRVNGKLEKILISDGAQVKRGELLFEIDSVPYKLAVRSAQAELRKATSLSVEAAELAKIGTKLFKNDVIPKEQLDQKQATAEEAEAGIDVARANLETSKQNLEYCKITAPIAGVLGRRLLDEGSLVSAYEDTIMVLNDVEKVKVLFSLSSIHLKNIKKYQTMAPLTVVINDSQESKKTLNGKLTYIANEIDQKSGMFEVQAEFDNKDRSFWPGEYVRATVTLTTRTNSIVIPYRALVNSEKQSDIVYVIKDNIAEARKIKVGWRVGDDVVIIEGIKKDEAVATNGIFKIYDGAKVQIVSNNTKTLK